MFNGQENKEKVITLRGIRWEIFKVGVIIILEIITKDGVSKLTMEDSNKIKDGHNKIRDGEAKTKGGVKAQTKAGEETIMAGVKEDGDYSNK